MRPSRIRRTAVATATTLVLTVAVLASPAQSDPTDPPSPGCGPADTAEQAAAAAAGCGVDIEILSERTPWVTSFATAEGTFRTETSSVAVRTDVNGEWEDINTTLEETSAGIAVTAAVFELTFSDGTPGQPLAIISDGERSLSMDAPVPLTVPTVDGSTVTYPQVLPDVDLILQVHPDGTGFSEVLRVATPEAAADPALAALDFQLQAAGDLTIVEQGQGFAAQDNSGQDVFVSPAPIMWDSASTVLVEQDAARMAGTSALDTASVDPVAEALQPADGDVIAPMESTLVDDTVTIEPDQELLNSPETVWPVYIDPSVSGTQAGRTIARAGFPTDSSFYNWSGDQGLGYCATSGGCDRNGAYRMFFNFSGLGAVGAAAPADIISATFRIYGHHSWSCTATGVQLWRTGAISSTTNWNNQPSWAQSLQTQNLAHKASCGNARWISWNALAAATHIASANASTVTFGLKTSNETSMASSWQRYRGDATFAVEYSRLPGAGTGQATTPATTCSVSSPSYIRTTTPQFRWNVADPDGGTVTGNIDIYRVASSGNVLVWNPTVATQASGTQFTMTVPSGLLVNGHTYEWQSGGIDVPTGRLGPVTKCRFTIDTTAPGPTTLIPTPDEAIYYENQISGAVGLRGSWNISNASSDIAYFKYSWNSDALNKVTYGTTMIARPDKPGSQRIVLQAVDKAGNTGPITTYRWSVNFPSVTARWELDDASGSTAADNEGTNHLTISASTTWTNGMLADVASDPTDTGLHFNSTSDYATSAGPAVITGTSYTVMAQVKLDTLTTTPQTAVSQSGQTTAAFHLGQLPAVNCGTLGQPCWFIQVKSFDVPSGNYTTATSTMPATTGEWVHLAGIVDTVNDTVSLYVCHPADTTEPVLAGPIPLVSPISWAAGGPIQLGRSVNTGATGYTNHWKGSIDDVRIYNNIIDVNTIRNTCWGG